MQPHAVGQNNIPKKSRHYASPNVLAFFPQMRLVQDRSLQLDGKSKIFNPITHFGLFIIKIVKDDDQSFDETHHSDEKSYQILSLEYFKCQWFAPGGVSVMGIGYPQTSHQIYNKDRKLEARLDRPELEARWLINKYIRKIVGNINYWID